MDSKYLDLLKKAFEIRKNAYVPYSHFKVGAALLCKNGKTYLGCNIENGAFGPTICSERTAIFEAVKNMDREFEAIAVVGGKEGDDVLEIATPCGVCRQVMTEFCDDDFKIIMAKMKQDGEILDEKIMTLDEILPLRFKLKK